jgi:Flp pilus assembly pilin Flp
MRRPIKQCARDENASAMVEYGLIVGAIALVVAGAAAVLGQDISTMFSELGSVLAKVPLPG